MKVAWFGHQSRGRGDGLVTYSLELTEGLRHRGAEVFFFYHGIDDDRGDDPGNIRIGSFNIGNHAIISSPGATRLIDATLRQERIEVAHASLSFSLLDFSLPDLCHDAGIPIAATVHFPYDRRWRLWSSGSRAVYLLWSGTLARYDAVIVFSEGQKELLAGYGVPRENLRVIPNGVDVDKWCPGPSDYKDEIGAEILVVYMGRVDPEKNVGELLEAFTSLNLPPTYKAVVVGDGMDRERLQDHYRNDRRVIFTGLIRDATTRVRILRAADIFVLPSDVEGLSLAMLEAMACGTPTIATDVGSDGEALAGAGIVIDPRELRPQLSLALQSLIDYPEFREALSQRARQRVLERYSLEANIDRVMDLYHELRGKR